MKGKITDLSFDEFIRLYFPDLDKVYPYQLEWMKSMNENPNRQLVWLNDRRRGYTLYRMLELHRSLLNNKNVLDLYLSLYFHFETNSEGHLELMIDVASQGLKGQRATFIEYDIIPNTGEIKKREIVKKKELDFHEQCLEALDYINEVT